MSARALALALAILVPPVSVPAAPIAFGASASDAKVAGAIEEQKDGKAAANGTPRGAGEKALARKIASLRKDCYGGQAEKPLPPIVLQARDRELVDATRRQERERASRAAKALLQGGDESLALVELHRQALEVSEDPADRKAAVACAELIKLAYPDDTPKLPLVPQTKPVK